MPDTPPELAIATPSPARPPGAAPFTRRQHSVRPLFRAAGHAAEDRRSTPFASRSALRALSAKLGLG
jgi:hypothetical protein